MWWVMVSTYHIIYYKANILKVSVSDNKIRHPQITMCTTTDYQILFFQFTTTFIQSIKSLRHNDCHLLLNLIFLTCKRTAISTPD